MKSHYANKVIEFIYLLVLLQYDYYNILTSYNTEETFDEFFSGYQIFFRIAVLLLLHLMPIIIYTLKRKVNNKKNIFYITLFLLFVFLFVIFNINIHNSYYRSDFTGERIIGYFDYYEIPYNLQEIIALIITLLIFAVFIIKSKTFEIKKVRYFSIALFSAKIIFISIISALWISTAHRTCAYSVFLGLAEISVLRGVERKIKEAENQ